VAVNCPEVVQAVNELARRVPIYQLRGTRMAIYVGSGTCS